MPEYTQSQRSRRRSEESVAPSMVIEPRLLLSSIIHDFDSLLTPVLTILEELQGRRVGTSRQLRKIDGAIYCAFRAKILARQLLDLANPRPARPEPVDVRQLIEAIEADLASVLSPHQNLAVYIADSLPLALIDRQLLERILLNLVLNARDAMPEGGHVTIAAELEFPSSSRAGLPERMIRLSITESGIGVNDRWLKKVSGEPNFSPKSSGDSLSLATVRRLTEILGGELSITSTPRRDTSVDLLLPAMAGGSCD